MHCVPIVPTSRLSYACIHSGLLLSHPAHFAKIVANDPKNPDLLGQQGSGWAA